MKENKFVMGEEEEPTQEKQSKKQYTRNHFKRRSSGRVHVTKLAPLVRANAHTDTEAEADDGEQTRPAIRRSQSQKSLHRLSSDRKGLSFTRRKSNASVRPPSADILKPLTTAPVTKTVAKTSTQNPGLLSNRSVAAPVEQTFNAVANNLVVPKISYSTIPEPPSEGIQVQHKKKLLKSQFLPSSYDEGHSPPKRSTSHENITPTLQMTRKSSPISRTQQKLMLQRQQAQTDDETSPIHPKNVQRLNREWELVGKEYRCIRRYQDPVRLSLSRVLDHSEDEKQQTYIPHLEQRQIIHRHHHLKTIALSRAQLEQPHREEPDSYGLLSSLFDRVFHKV